MNDDTCNILGRRERPHLEGLEEKIKTDLHSLSDLVKHLNEVDQYHLWREGYTGFGNYCAKKWGLHLRLVNVLNAVLNLE